MSRKTKVLIVDDSALVRQTLADIISGEDDMELLGVASDPFYAAQKLAKELPDVITLDIEMPRMDGLTFLKKIMSQHPIPVVIISSLTDKGTEAALKAMEYGAVEIITKPQMNTRQFIEESKIRIADAIRSAAACTGKIERKKFKEDFVPTPKYSADSVIPPYPVNQILTRTTDLVIAIGASTGGTEALLKVLEKMPVDCPAIVIVQHMPENFTRSFANRLNSQCIITVKEAEHGDLLSRGTALLAPGNKHILLNRSGAKYFVEIKDGQLVNRHRPSVDVLFRTTARYAGINSIGVILTGMGDDGAKGMLEMKQAGSKTIAQDEKSSIIFGMPNEAIKLGAVDHIVSLENIASKIMELEKNIHENR